MEGKDETEKKERKEEAAAKAEAEEKVSTVPLLLHHNGTWLYPNVLPQLQHFQQRYSPQPGDVLLASVPKSGTTWTMALLHCLLNLNHQTTPLPLPVQGAAAASASASSSFEKDVLKQTFEPQYSQDDFTGGVNAAWNKHVQALIPLIERITICNETCCGCWTDLVPPRLFRTHLPFEHMPKALRDSPLCRIVYVLRNPRDAYVSRCKFLQSTGIFERDRTDVCAEATYKRYCDGVFLGGPFPDHVLSYWRERERNPDRVLWLTYEELQKDCLGCVLRMGQFLGCPGDVLRANAAAIVKKCSFESMATAEVHKSGHFHIFPSSSFFREGKCGSWRKYFNADMEQLFYCHIEAPLAEHGIHFSYDDYSNNPQEE